MQTPPDDADVTASDGQVTSILDSNSTEQGPSDIIQDDSLQEHQHEAEMKDEEPTLDKAEADRNGESVDQSEHPDQNHKPTQPSASDHESQKTEDLQNSIRQMNERIASLETQLHHRRSSYASGVSDNDDEPIKVIPKLRRVEWDEFKNKVFREDQTCAIEVLVGGAKYHYQRAEEEKKGRRRVEDDKDLDKDSTDKNTEVPSTESRSSKELPERIRINSRPVLAIFEQIQPDRTWNPPPIVMLRPYKPLVYWDSRLRQILHRLETTWGEDEKRIVADEAVKENAANTPDAENPGAHNITTEAGPTAINGETKISEKLNGNIVVPKIQDDIPEIAPQTNTESTTLGDHPKIEDRAMNGDVPMDETAPEPPEDLANTVEALRDLRCLIEFMDHDLKSTQERYKNNSCQKIFFSDLWHIFKPGELIHCPLNNKAETEVAYENMETEFSRKPIDRFQEVWRVDCTTDGRANLRAFKRGANDNTPVVDLKVNPFILRAYYIDFNGSWFEGVTFQFHIKPFTGERDILSLPFYPLRFSPKAAGMKSKWKARGESFKEFVSFQHRYYTGRSLICHPNGDHPADNNLPKHAENIDSQVVVDFSEAISSNPGWSPDYREYSPFQTRLTEFEEDYPLTYWKEKDRKEVDHTRTECFHIDRHIDTKLMEEQRERNGLIQDGQKKGNVKHNELTEEHLILLPNRVFAFVLRNRKFAILTVDGLRPIKPHRNGFNDLKLPRGHKEMVNALVRNHFTNKGAELNDREMSYDSDLVRGKGKGLIVLLHGAPGTGKTSTAECVAEANGKLLFPITCGDLGLTSNDVERELSEKFHLAELWDCVLLLDEADVFLAQRTKSDVVRNSLVSVFLRVLEYFTGILFLTTNRVGAFDEAFKSRIHISLYYPPLGWRQTDAIWRMNMDRLRDKKVRRKESIHVHEDQVFSYAREHYDLTQANRANWNGRQIRNAFQTATALAEYEAQEQDVKLRKSIKPEDFMPTVPELKVEHFEIVAQASLEFDNYLVRVRGTTDASRAYMNEERADQYHPGSGAFPHRQQRPTQQQQQQQTPLSMPRSEPRSRNSQPPSSQQQRPIHRSSMRQVSPSAFVEDRQQPYYDNQGAPEIPPHDQDDDFEPTEDQDPYREMPSAPVWSGRRGRAGYGGQGPGGIGYSGGLSGGGYGNQGGGGGLGSGYGEREEDLFGRASSPRGTPAGWRPAHGQGQGQGFGYGHGREEDDY